MECEAQVLDGFEGADPGQLLLESDEPLGAPVSFRRPHEGRRGLDPQKGELSFWKASLTCWLPWS